MADLAPSPGEEEALAAERQRLQQGERRAAAIATALAEIAPQDRRSPGPASSLRAASRALQKLAAPGAETDPLGPVLAALERAEDALAESETLLTRLSHDQDGDPRRLEQAEERLFALRAAGRKHGVPVTDLPELLAALRARLAALDGGTAQVVALEAEAARHRSAYIEAACALSRARAAAVVPAATRRER